MTIKITKRERDLCNSLLVRPGKRLVAQETKERAKALMRDSDPCKRTVAEIDLELKGCLCDINRFWALWANFVEEKVGLIIKFVYKKDRISPVRIEYYHNSERVL